MPRNKNAMTRYKYLDDLLSNRYRQYSLNDRTDAVNTKLIDFSGDEESGVTRRQIEKDLRNQGKGAWFADFWISL